MKDNEIFIKTCIPGLDDAIPGFPRGGLILVSGKPGSGKTIMGMTFIYRGALEAGEPGIYISVYESRERFLQLAKRLGMDFEKLEEKGLFKHVWMPVTMEAGAATAINMILEQIEKMGAKRLVIDSITALKQQFKDPLEARILLQTLLSKIVENLKCTTTLIKEGDPLTGPLDFEEYVADAVIHLERGYFEGRPLRRLEILKLRGVDIIFPRLVCTIHEGFKVMPTRPPRLEKPTRQEAPEAWPPPDPPGAYTTGIPDLDRVVGGYPEGSIVLIEIDPRLTIHEHCLIYAPTLASFALRGRHAMIVPSGGVNPGLIREISSYYGVGEQTFLERYHIFYEKGAITDKRRQNVIELEHEDIEKATRQIIELGVRLTGETGRPVAVHICVDRLIQLAGREELRWLTLMQDYAKTYKNLLIWNVKPIMPWIIERLAPAADIHLKITREHGSMFLYGIKPRTTLHSIQLKPGKTPPIPDLIPVT
jgi:KaiC/GvpD/RAD55 family RecA-like ATPase